MLANYHTHTSRCNHARGSDREYVENAIKHGMKVLGFSDHCPWVFPDEYVSGTRMLPSQIDDYFKSLKDQKQTVILVTHSMENVTKFCTRAILIESGKIIQDGDPKEVSSTYTKMLTN